MERDGRGLRLASGGELAAPHREVSLQVLHARSYVLRLDGAGDDHVDDPGHSPLRLGDLALDDRAVAATADRQRAALLVIGRGVLGQEARIRQLVPQALDNQALDHVEVVAAAVVAAAAFLHARADDPHTAVVAVERMHPGSASSAAQQSGQQSLRSRTTRRRGVRAALFARPGRCEQIGWDDRKSRDLRRDPLALGVRPRDTAARSRVLHHPDPIPDQATGIDLVQQDAVTARLVAVDRRRRPGESTRRRDAIRVERAGDLAGALTLDIGAEDPAHDLGFRLKYGHLAGSARHRAIAVGAAACMSAVAHNARHASLDLARAFLSLHLPNQAVHADLQRIELPAIDAVDLDAAEGQLLVQPRQVSHVAGDPVSGFRNHDIELAGTAPLDQLGESVAAEHAGAGTRTVAENFDDAPASPRAVVATKRDLIVD